MAAPDPKKPLGWTRKRRAFLEHYLQCWNGREAARRAGYAERGARERAHELLSHPEMQAAFRERLESLTMGTDELLVRLAEQARAEYAIYLGANGSVDIAGMIADGKAHLIKGTKWDARGNLTVEFHDAQRALELIGKHLGMFRDRLEVSGPDGEPLRLTWDDGTETPAFTSAPETGVE